MDQKIEIYQNLRADEKTTYEQLLSLASQEVSVLKDDNERLQKKVHFLQIRRDSSAGDIVFAAPGLCVTAQRAIMAAKSVFFQVRVPSDTADEGAEVIRVRDISPAVLEAVVEFCYTADVAFSELVPAYEVIECSHTFKLGLLREYCDNELCRGLTIENLPQMLKLARKFNATRLREEAGKMFKEHFDLVQSKFFEVLEGFAGSTAESGSGACLESGSTAKPGSEACLELDKQPESSGTCSDDLD